jgi:hypothetical protein
LLVVSCVIIGFSLNDVFAGEQEILSQSFSFENTFIIEFTNNGTKEIKSIRIWLDDYTFDYFKSEIGWTSKVTPQGVIFTTSDPIKANETVKFGIKTKNLNPLIQWETFDKKETQIEIGDIQSHTPYSLSTVLEPESPDSIIGILSESNFKVIPENPSPGSLVRVAGDNFAQNSDLELFLNDIKLQSFETDENGNFVLTIEIPKNLNPEKVNFILKDKQENEKAISISLVDPEQKIPKNIDLTVSETQNKFLRTENIEYSGTANSDVHITITIKDPQNDLFSSRVINPDSQGYWSVLIPIPLNVLIGKYSVEITDGKTTISESWDVAMSKKIQIFPIKTRFQPGDLIKFNVIANPDERINIKFVDPQGNDILSKNFIVDSSGSFEIEYPTLPSSLKGTYFLYAFQDHEFEIASIGLDKNPQKTFSAKLNKVNYNDDDIAIIGMTGSDSHDPKVLILDQIGNEKFNDQIEIGPDGKRNYELDLTNFSTGVYTLLASMGDFQTSEIFTVGLEPSSRPITLNIFEKTYNPGQSIFVTGKSEPNTTLNLSLVNPDGIIINDKESFVNKKGDLSVGVFIIPYDVTFGKWIIVAESGILSANSAFQVGPLENEGLLIHVTDIFSSSVGKFVTIEGSTNAEETVKIIIKDQQENIIFQTNVKTTESGEFDLLWKVQENSSGTYSVIAEDSIGNTVSTIFGL